MSPAASRVLPLILLFRRHFRAALIFSVTPLDDAADYYHACRATLMSPDALRRYDGHFHYRYARLMLTPRAPPRLLPLHFERYTHAASPPATQMSALER